jgi:hypothetical protein
MHYLSMKSEKFHVHFLSNSFYYLIQTLAMLKFEEKDAYADGSQYLEDMSLYLTANVTWG